MKNGAKASRIAVSAEAVTGGDDMDEFKVGQYIIYHNGDHYELGRIKTLQPDGAFVAYHSGETGAKTPYDLMHPLVNEFVIKNTLLGGGYFDED